MKEIFKTSGLKKLAAAVCILLALDLFTSAAAGNLFSNLLGLVTTPLLRLTAHAASSVTEYLDLDAMTKEELKERNRELAAENEELRQQLLDYYEKVKENEQLKTQLGIKEEEPEVSHVAATVIARNPNDAFYGFSIDKGSLAGVEKGDPVITDDGLVGITTDVYATTSHVSTIFSEDVKVAAVSQRYGESGVIVSSTMLAANGMLRLDYLSNDTKLEPGTVISTSGSGGIYPKDLTVGYVKSIEQSEFTISKYAIIQPYADIKNVTNVYVVTDFPGKNEDGPAVADGGSTQADPEAGQ